MILTRFIPENSIKVTDKNSDAVAYLYDNGRDICAIGYHGRANKPDFRFRFMKEADRTKKIEGHFNWRRKHAERKAAIKAERKVPHTLKVGDIVNAIWGYEQTNVDWYQVVNVNGAHTVTLREIATNKESTEWCQANETPMKGSFKGEPMLKRVSQHNSITIDRVRHASLWDGNAVSTSSYH